MPIVNSNPGQTDAPALPAPDESDTDGLCRQNPLDPRDIDPVPCIDRTFSTNRDGEWIRSENWMCLEDNR